MYGFASGPVYIPPPGPLYNPPPGPSLSGPVDPNWDTSANAPSAGNAASAQVIIFMKDGTSFSPSDYWLTGSEFHYVLGGTESVIDVDRVDMPRSNDENFRNGVKFWIKSAPSPSEQNAAPSGDAPAAPAAPEPQNEAPAPKAAPEPQPL